MSFLRHIEARISQLARASITLPGASGAFQFHHQSRRFFQHENILARCCIQIEHDPSYAGVCLPDPDAIEVSIMSRDLSDCQFRTDPGAEKIEIQALGIRQPVELVPNFCLQIDDDSGEIRLGPETYPFNLHGVQRTEGSLIAR